MSQLPASPLPRTGGWKVAHPPRAGGEAGSGLLGAGGGLGVKPPRAEEEVGSGGKCARSRALAKQGRRGLGLSPGMSRVSCGCLGWNCNGLWRLCLAECRLLRKCASWLRRLRLLCFESGVSLGQSWWRPWRILAEDPNALFHGCGQVRRRREIRLFLENMV